MHVCVGIPNAGDNGNINMSQGIQNDKKMEIILGFLILVALMAIIVAIIITGEINSQDREELKDTLKDPTIRKE